MQHNSKPTLLLYNIKGSTMEKPLAFLCMRLKIRAKIISIADYQEPLGILAGIKNFNYTSTKDLPVAPPPFTDPMIVFHGFSTQLFNITLRELRSSNIHVDLKAVLTPHNIHWSSNELYQELLKEHQKFLEAEQNNS